VRAIRRCRPSSTNAVAAAPMEADIATRRKKGMRTGFSVQHPFTGNHVEVWVANYVLMAYGEGAVMGVPAHDARDYEFALKNKLPIVQVVKSKTGAYGNVDPPWQDAYTEYGTLVNSGEFDGLDFQPAVDAIAAALEKKGWAASVSNGVCATGASRASVTGAAPCRSSTAPRCGVVPVPDDQLPVVLPEGLVPDGSGNPLNKTPSFYECKCPRCGADARRETDTDGHVRGLVVVLPAIRLSGREDHGRRARRLLAARGPIHRRYRTRHPAPAVLALLDQGHARHEADFHR
jgi:leucyl-tRNA synthetase